LENIFRDAKKYIPLMKLILQVLFILLTWFANLVNATPAFPKVTLPIYEFSFSKTENVKEDIVVNIGSKIPQNPGFADKVGKLFGYDVQSLKNFLNTFDEKEIAGYLKHCDDLPPPGTIGDLSHPTNVFLKELDDVTDIPKLKAHIKSRAVQGAGEYANIDEFWAKILGNVNEIKDAFTASTLKYAQEDMYVFRHCNNGAPQLSNWFTDEILSASQARIKLALPNSNTAQRVVKVKIPKGTAYVEGGVASQVNNSSGLFGNYATGGGKQFYFLDEDKVLFQVIEDIPNPKGN
jgi:hypothetical protein